MGSPATPEINFVGGDELSDRPGGKFVRWALSWGKVVIVFTELIVISAFLSRFWLDSQIADLNETITQKKAIVEASANFEKRFRSVVSRVDQVVKITNDEVVDKVLVDARDLVPDGVLINSLSVNKKIVAMSGSTATESALAILSRAYKDSPKFTDVNLQRVVKGENKNVSGIDFSLQATWVDKISK